MTLYRRGKVWWFEFLLNGIRVRQSSKLTNKELARKVESATRNAMALSAGGVEKVPDPMLFAKAAESYLLDREAHWSAKTREMHTNSLAHLKPHFTKLLVQDVKAEHIPDTSAPVRRKAHRPKASTWKSSYCGWS